MYIYIKKGQTNPRLELIWANGPTVNVNQGENKLGRTKFWAYVPRFRDGSTKIKFLLTYYFDFHGFSRYGGEMFAGIMPTDVSLKYQF